MALDTLTFGTQVSSNGVLEHGDGQWVQQLACTVAMLRQVFDNQIMLLRRQWDDAISTTEMKREIIKNKTAEYIQSGEHNVSHTFIMGRTDSGVPAVWHCTWYFYVIKFKTAVLVTLIFIFIKGVSNQKGFAQSGEDETRKTQQTGDQIKRSWI